VSRIDYVINNPKTYHEVKRRTSFVTFAAGLLGSELVSIAKIVSEMMDMSVRMINTVCN
jgi:hypothetical protein